MKKTTKILEEASSLLKKVLLLPNGEERLDLCRQIKTLEMEGDDVTGEILQALNSTFITPFDREDIDALTDSLDDVIDSINRAAHKVQLYSPLRLPECTKELSDIICTGAIEIVGATGDLERLKNNDQNIKTHYKKIKELEEEADAIYESGIIKLFKEEKDTTELIKEKEIIQELERTSNKINNTGKIFKTIFVKYA